MAETEALLAKGDRMMEEEVNHLRQQLGTIPEIINLSCVARRYFGKSRTWLYHKLDGIDGNKKPTEFSEEEKYTLKGALIDLADRIRRAADKIQ